MKKTTATAIPNELFSYELKIRHWTEVNVAIKLESLDENTIGRWKRGIASPTIQMRPKIAALFGKEVEKLGWPGKNKIPNWKLDNPLNPLFTAREDILYWLHDGLALCGTGVSLPVQALTGLGGVGKSQIAIEYAHKFKYKYHTVIWLRASSSEALAADFAAIASHIGLDLPKNAKNDQVKQIDAVKAWLNHEEITRWLLIFDGADDPAILNEILHRYVPEPRQGHVIITTRSRATGEIEQRKEVDPLSVEESVHFLLRRAKMAPIEANNAVARTIAEKLGGLPLALEQAGAYIEEKGCSFARYLKLYETKARKKLLGHKGNVTEHDPVAITFSLTFDQIQQANPTAIDLLSLFAFYAPDYIPEEFVREGASVLSSNLQTIVEHPDVFEDAVGELNKYSLIHRFIETETCSIHQLVQTCMKDSMDEETQKLWAEYAIKAVSQFAPVVTSVQWTSFERYFSHAQKCLDHIGQWDMTSPDVAYLLLTTGVYLMQRAAYVNAQQLLQKAQHMYEINFGPDSTGAANCLSALAYINMLFGNYSTSEAMQLQALAIFEQISGPKSPETSSAIHNLAHYYLRQRKFEQAEHFFTRSIDINNHIYEANDPGKVASLSDLAAVYTETGRYAEAEHLLLQSIEILKLAGIQEDAGRFTYVFSYLAGLYAKEERYADAEEIYLYLIELNEKVLGRGHPEVMALLNQLGVLYVDQNKNREAEISLFRALSNAEDTLGTYSILRVADTLLNLGLLYENEGKDITRAKFFFQKAIFFFQTDDRNDLGTAIGLAHLAGIYMAENRLLEAKPLFQQSLVIYDVLVDYPEVVPVRSTYIAVLQILEEYEEAQEQISLLPPDEDVDVDEWIAQIKHIQLVYSQGN